MEHLHHVMDRIKSELNFKPDDDLDLKEKTGVGSTSLYPQTFKRTIRRIESRYT